MNNTEERKNRKATKASHVSSSRESSVDIQRWIKDVHKYSNGREDMFSASGDINEKLEDASHAEAQVIVNTWLREKLYDEITDDTGDHSVPFPQWQCPHQDKDISTDSKDLYHEIQERDDSVAVASILNSMRSTPIAIEKQSTWFRQYETKNVTDPKTTMEMRHKQVRENRQHMEKEKWQKQKEKLARKAAVLEAKELLKKEEHERRQKEKQEEMELQKEMATLRREMQMRREAEDNLKKLRQKKREERVRKSIDATVGAGRCAVADVRHDVSVPEPASALKLKNESQIIERLAVIEVKRNLQSKRRVFAAWYSLLLQKRAQMGQVRALAEWKCVLRAWNSWRAYIRSIHLKQEAILLEAQARAEHRKMLLAVQHHRHATQRKYFLIWRLVIQRQIEYNNQQVVALETRNKMDAFLGAIASGTLSGTSGENKSSPGKLSESVAKDKYHEDVKLPASQSDSALKVSLPHGSTSLRTKCGVNRLSKKNSWQLSQKDIHVVKSTLDLPSSGGSSSSLRQGGARRGAVYSHRFATQHKMLGEQKKLIHQQQQQIDELHFLCRQQQLKDKLRSIHKQRMSTTPGNHSPVQNTTVVDGGSPVVSESDGSRVNTSASHVTLSDNASFATTTISIASEFVTEPASKRQTKPLPLVCMEERAKVRAERRAAIEERKRKQAAEEAARLRAVEEEQQRQEEEEKKKRLAERRERKLLEKQQEEERQQRLEAVRQKNRTAGKHYKVVLLRRSFCSWRKLVTEKHKQQQMASEHHRKTLLRKCLHSWHAVALEFKTQNTQVADDMYRLILTRQYFQKWKEYGKKMLQLEERAQLLYSEKLQRKVLHVWLAYTTDENLLLWQQETKAKKHDERRLKQKMFCAWKALPRIVKALRAKELRKAELRRKVAAILPDYVGPDGNEFV
ncbi:PREDICTED: coiled-coil domain-containing protein KIAA1407 homolog isoform X2 [Priapulus caudatus]|uniref:Coiled-coil domain-containing protein KIAA1407 homolog isoform X2 n=1 Tax=Priapulus caudatus TaxID=37621 RepID=A0ABM1E330_PRICU|nr:PREDICTED: coiled-coil domain-containing protein KIAA1407 homolog isoform X2 [Priapulus caudatus]